MRYILGSLISSVLLSGCASIISPAGLPATPGETAAGYGYVPLDSLPIDQIGDADSCTEEEFGGINARNVQSVEPMPILKALPDLTIRFAVASLDGGGGLTFGPSKVTAKGKAYRAVLDYVNADGVPVDFYVRRRVALRSADGSLGPVQDIPINEIIRKNWVSVGYDVQISPIFLRNNQKLGFGASTNYESQDAEMKVNGLEKDGYRPITFPIYVGVGLRLSADVRALESDINLSGLGVIGAQADAKRLSGTLTVQTLGVNGKAVAMALPLPNKLDQTTVETAILSIGSMRAILYSNSADDGVIATPRVVGLYSPIGSDPALINGIYSELSRIRPKWRRPCQAKSG